MKKDWIYTYLTQSLLLFTPQESFIQVELNRYLELHFNLVGAKI